MPAPLIWLGVGLASMYASGALTKEYQKKNRNIRHYPGESSRKVRPVDGAVVSCGIFSLFDHTGIWLDDSVVELRGNGLVRAVSPRRFLHNRSGEQIFVACDEMHEPLVAPHAAQSAAKKLFNYSPYHVIDNNCHRFVWNCISGKMDRLTRFSDLNQRLNVYFRSAIHWHLAEI